MGWTGFYPAATWVEKSEMVELHKPYKLHKLLKVGNVWFSAFEPEPGTIIIGLVLTKRYDGEFMYKTMDETMGPADPYCRCPKSILNLATEPTNEYAAEFRQKCLDWHNRPKPKAGDKFILAKPLKLSNGTSLTEVVRAGWGRMVFHTTEGVVRLQSSHLVGAKKL